MSSLINTSEAGKKGIYVANVPDYGVEEVADSAMCMLLNLLRKTVYSSIQKNVRFFFLLTLLILF